MAQAAESLATLAQKTAYVKAASDEKALAATRKLTKGGKIKGGALTLTQKPRRLKGLRKTPNKP